MLQSAAVVLLQFCFTNANSLLVLCVRRGLSKNEFEVGHLGGGTVVGGFVRPWLCVVYLGLRCAARLCLGVYFSVSPPSCNQFLNSFFHP